MGEKARQISKTYINPDQTINFNCIKSRVARKKAGSTDKAESKIKARGLEQLNSQHKISKKKTQLIIEGHNGQSKPRRIDFSLKLET